MTYCTSSSSELSEELLSKPFFFLLTCLIFFYLTVLLFVAHKIVFLLTFVSKIDFTGELVISKLGIFALSRRFDIGLNATGKAGSFADILDSGKSISFI